MDDNTVFLYRRAGSAAIPLHYDERLGKAGAMVLGAKEVGVVCEVPPKP